MAGSRKLVVEILGDAKGFAGAIGEADGKLAKFGSGIASFAKTAAIGFAAAGAGAAVFAKGAIDAAMESQKIAAQTEAVIKSTGAAAGVTADEIGNMATALSKKNAVDDEAIQTGQNLLLTFTNIGKAEGIFERTTQASIDMAAAMGTDVKTAAMQLGKALNDPADGLSKLTRAGIQFTDEQKDQIKAMQEAGDMAGAQKVMLAELERQFGGSAAAQATATDRMKIAFGNFQEQIGAMLIPIVEKLAVVMTEKVLPVLSRFGEWLGVHLPPVMAAIADFVQTKVIPVLRDLGAWIEEHLVPAIMKLWASFEENILPTLRDKVLPVLAQLGEWIVQYVLPAVGKLVTFIIDKVIPALFEIAGFIFEEVIPALVSFGQKIGEVVATLAGWVVAVWTFGGQVLDFFRELPGQIAGFFTGLYEFIVSPFRDAFNWVKDKWDRSIGPIVDKLGAVGGFVGGAVSGVAGKIPGFDSGGVVPGPRGSAQLILAHGGETVLPTHRTSMSTGGITIIVQGSVVAERELVSILKRAQRDGVFV